MFGNNWTSLHVAAHIYIISIRVFNHNHHHLWLRTVLYIYIYIYIRTVTPTRMFHINLTYDLMYTHFSFLTAQIQLLPDSPEQKCCLSHRLPAELQGFGTVYHLVLVGGGFENEETGTYLDPKLLTSLSDRLKCAGTHPPFHMFC